MKPRRSLLHERLSAERPVYCVKSDIPHPMVPELLGNLGVHCLWLDTEHLPRSHETIALLAQAARGVDTDVLVRIPNGDYGAASLMFDLGADAIMYPQVWDPADVARLVEATRFPPLGRRSIDSFVTATRYGQIPFDTYRAHTAEHSHLFIQIETPEALACIDKIAATPGISALFIGPGDLSLTLGKPNTADAAHIVDAMERTAAAAKEHGLAWGMPGLSMDHVRTMLAIGARFIAYGSDVTLLGQQVERMLAEVAAATEQYGGE